MYQATFIAATRAVLLGGSGIRSGNFEVAGKHVKCVLLRRIAPQHQDVFTPKATSNGEGSQRG